MPSTARRAGSAAMVLALAAGALVALTPAATAADPVDQALNRLDRDADRALTIRADGTGSVDFVGVPARADVDNPAVRPSMSAGAAADAAITRYGGAVGGAQEGTTLERTAVQPTATGDAARYQQVVDGVPVLGGEVVVSLREDGELSSMLSRTTQETSVDAATVSEDDAAEQARAAFVKAAGTGAGVQIARQGRWLLDAGLIGGSDAASARTVWRFEVSRAADERRMVLIDDRSGGVAMDVDLVEHAVDRVVCDNHNVRRSGDIPCTAGFARTEGGAASSVADVNTAYDLSGVVADFYQQVGGIDLTELLGITVAGQKKLASTVRWCYTTSVDDPTTCPYDNAFWNGSQMYYGAGYAGADDVVGHEMTHGFTERNSGLFYWGQSGAMNESISDIIGEIVDHRHPSTGDSSTSWSIGEDVPAFASHGGLRNMQDPTLFGDPDRTSSAQYVMEGNAYPDSDGVHTNSGVGNKTFYLISQGGTFNGQTVAGIDAGDSALTRSAKLWLLVDQSLSSGSDWADEADVLDQSCQALLAAGEDGFTSGDCESVHRATLATELRLTPRQNPQPADATVTCPSGSGGLTLFDSESGTPTSKFTAGSTWGRGSEVVHSGDSAWLSNEPTSAGASSLTMTDAITLPAGRSSYLFFQRWHVLDYSPSQQFDAMTVEVNGGDVAGRPWVNGPTGVIAGGSANPAAGRSGFGGDSRGFTASRLDLSAYAGTAVRVRFTMNTDNAVSFVGLALDDIQIYTCDVAPGPAAGAAPSITGTPRVGRPLSATPGTWTPAPDSVSYQWLRGGAAIAGATGSSYTPGATDVGSTLAVRVTAAKTGYGGATATSPATPAVATGALTSGRPAIAGKARVGKKLTARAGAWKPPGVRLRYQWLRNGKPIAKATTSAYKLAAKDKGRRISVRVTGSKAGYATTSATSKATAKVKAKPQKRKKRR